MAGKLVILSVLHRCEGSVGPHCPSSAWKAKRSGDEQLKRRGGTHVPIYRLAKEL